MRMIGQAMINYAADNRNYLPEHAYNDAWWQGSGHAGTADIMQDGTPDWTYLMQAGNGQSHTMVLNVNGHIDPGANIGRLILTGYLGGYDLSPANAQNNINNASFAPIRWCPAVDPGSLSAGGLQSSYFMNPHWSFTTAGGTPITQYPIAGTPVPMATNAGTTFHTTWFRKITDYPKTMAMLCETYWDVFNYGGQSAITHPGPGGTSYWNILLPDGHVATVNDKYLVQNFNLGPQGLNSGTAIIPGYSPQPILNAFDDALDIIETEADGRNPVAPGKSSAMALPGYSAEIPASPIYDRCFFYPSESKSPPVNWGY
jgi:hypothetical protein